jgi:hypothetical protein
MPKRLTGRKRRIIIPGVKPMVSKVRRYELTEEEWEHINPTFLRNKKPVHEGGHPRIPGKCSTESSGFFEAELPGEIFPSGMDLGKPFTSGL